MKTNISVGIVGHRLLTAAASSFLRDSCHHILQALKKDYTAVTACSAIAEGADSIFADVALTLQLPLSIVTPFAAFEQDFEEAAALQTYRRLHAAANRRVALTFEERSVDAYVEAMCWILQQSDIIIAAWNGSFTGGRGGTADAVKIMMNSGQDWIHIDTSLLKIEMHIKNHPFRLS